VFSYKRNQVAFVHDTAPTTLYLDNANIGLNLNVKKESGLQQDEFCKLHNGL